IRDGQLVVYHGNYNYYLELKEEERVRELEAKKAAEKAAEQAAKRAKELAKQKIKEEAKKGR
ncbi:ABC transporter ATP-binding protein, partial [bacterium]|nr:ABC transporter ATP-binding protein [bacterium]